MALPQDPSTSALKKQSWQAALELELEYRTEDGTVDDGARGLPHTLCHVAPLRFGSPLRFAHTVRCMPPRAAGVEPEAAVMGLLQVSISAPALEDGERGAGGGSALRLVDYALQLPRGAPLPPTTTRRGASLHLSAWPG